MEPNSGLGEAITYMLKRWDKFTLFLRQAGAPLDNNLCERALKKVILHRKNAMFYKTENGAHVADVYMSLIYTCELCGANPFDYLTELQRHAPEVAANPACWMPWNYRETLAVVPATTGPPATATTDNLRDGSLIASAEAEADAAPARGPARHAIATVARGTARRWASDTTPCSRRPTAVRRSGSSASHSTPPADRGPFLSPSPLAPALVRLSKRSAAASGRAFREPSCFRPRQPSPAADCCRCGHAAPAMPRSAFSATVLNRSPAHRNRSRHGERPRAPSTATSARLNEGPPPAPGTPHPRRPPPVRPSTSSTSLPPHLGILGYHRTAPRRPPSRRLPRRSVAACRCATGDRRATSAASIAPRLPPSSRPRRNHSPLIAPAHRRDHFSPRARLPKGHIFPRRVG